jgi:hypothetical protein
MEIIQYQLNTNSGSARFNKEEHIQVNQLIIKLGELSGNQFDSFKSLFTYCLRSAIELNSMKTNVNTIENNEIKEITEQEELNTEVIEYITEVEDLNTSENLNELRRLLIQSIGYEETPTDEALFTDLLDIINTPLSPAPTVEISKEVEKPLEPNQLLLNLTPEQKVIIEKIARWRSFKKIDQPISTLEVIAKGMIFNMGSLTNDHGQFETGLIQKRI